MGLETVKSFKICAKTLKPCDIFNKAVWYNVKSQFVTKLAQNLLKFIQLYGSLHVFETFSSQNIFVFIATCKAAFSTKSAKS